MQVKEKSLPPTATVFIQMQQERWNKKKSTSCTKKTPPVALQRALWLITSLHFGCRARDEAKKTKWGDIKLVKDPEGVEMLVWNTERGTKTRNGEKAQASQRKFPPMAVVTDRCPVK